MEMIEFEGYFVREDGAVFNKSGNRISAPLNRNGYPRVTLYNKGKAKRWMLHILVAKLFVRNPHPRKYKIVLHLDDDRTNAHKNNLMYGTQSMNMKDMMAKGRGKNQFRSKKYGRPI